VDTTDWLIVAAVAGPVAGALLSPFTGAAVLQLARVRARRVQHVPASGADLMLNGVPLAEEQFRDAWAIMQAELDELPPPAERNEGQLKRCYDTINRFSMLTGRSRRPSRCSATSTPAGPGTRSTTSTSPAQHPRTRQRRARPCSGKGALPR